MNNKDIIPYLLENERRRYEYAKEMQKTLRWAILSVLGAIVIIAVAYMYLVVPVEEVTVDGNSRVVMQSTVDNGSSLWQ